MTEHEREKAFPIHVELGKRVTETAMPETVSNVSSKKYYPTLFINEIDGLEGLPKEGCILLDYKLRSKTVRQSEGKTTCSVELECRTICMPDDYEGDMEDIVESMVKKAYAKHEASETEEEEEEEHSND